MQRLVLYFGLVLISGCATSLDKKLYGVEPGTTAQTIYDQAGAPDSRTHKSDGSELWRWYSNYTHCSVHMLAGAAIDYAKCDTDLQAKSEAKKAAIAAIGDNLSHRKSFGDVRSEKDATQSTASLTNCGYQPYATYGCTQSCMNGHWVQICN